MYLLFYKRFNCFVNVSLLYLAPHADKIKVAAIGTIAHRGAEKLNS
jgi:hypothetical protein